MEVSEGIDNQALLQQIQMDDEQNMTREEALAKVSMILAKTDNPKIMSDIDIREVGLVSALSTVGSILDYDIINNFVHENFLQLRVSKDRQGRKEILEIASEVRRTPERVMGLRRFLGR